MKMKINLLVSSACFFISAASAADFPSKELTMVIPYPPGGITDIVGRTVAEQMGQDLGQPVVVENRSGAGGSIGASYAARAKADGYTIYLGTSATHGTNPSTYKNLSYDPVLDFEPVSLLASAPLVIITSNALPVESLQEFIDYAKDRPGELSYATTGTGGSVHLTTEEFAMLNDLDIVHVPYKGSSPALTDVVGKRIDVMFDNVPSATPFIKAGKVKALAVTSSDRSLLLPDVKTVAESTNPGFDSGSWIALYAPKGTPDNVIQKLNESANNALKRQSLIDIFTEAGLSTQGGSTEDLQEHQQGEITKWAEVVEAIGYEPQ